MGLPSWEAIQPINVLLRWTAMKTGLPHLGFSVPTAADDDETPADPSARQRNADQRTALMYCSEEGPAAPRLLRPVEAFEIPVVARHRFIHAHPHAGAGSGCKKGNSRIVRNGHEPSSCGHDTFNLNYLLRDKALSMLIPLPVPA